ncbi:hypothetical protein MSUIS_01080 [Mycoplasma suis KI3806]|uniref:Uncharacterized protein n=1 Tax=Mycoplasma suis (strain KI_3806) TaxID=708248 RepID=F0V2X9_MYCS3|nr:hypothetical protein [Mycoplasma suis]CBZ40201.1 hypothetical protein MSUIS_01080 [Mycoplasma suis KI3806]
MTGVFSLTKVALSLLSLGGTFGGGSFGLMTLLEGEKQTSQKASLVESSNSGSEQIPSKELGSENSSSTITKGVEQTRKIQKRSVDSPKPWVNTEYVYVERKNGEIELSCDKLRPNQLFTDYVEPWMCERLFKNIWKENKENAPQRIFSINGDGAFNTLNYYFGLGERKNDEHFREELKKGISLKDDIECKSSEEKEGKLIVTCNPKTVSEQNSIN